jgi:hypothetical protein
MGFPAPPFIDFTACTGFPTIVLATHMMTTLKKTKIKEWDMGYMT